MIVYHGSNSRFHNLKYLMLYVETNLPKQMKELVFIFSQISYNRWFESS